MNDGWRWIATLGGAIAAIVVWLSCRNFGLDDKQALVAATTALCAVWWCSEALPIPATALIPFVVFPIGGILTQDQLSAAYGDRFVILFLAGFMLSKAAEKSRTHLQVAQGMMKLIGDGSQRRIVIGFLAASAFVSMWISNTAAALILLPVALAVLERQGDPKLDAPLLLALAYGSSIGGMATLIGTPPNGVFAGAYAETTGRVVDFVSFFSIGAPITIILVVFTAFLLTIGLGKPAISAFEKKEPWTHAQVRVFLVFAAAAALWITHSIPFGGWEKWFDLPQVHDATVGLAAVAAMFLIPNGEQDEKGRSGRLLDWETAVRIPWGVLLLFGGGIAIASAFKESGLADLVGQKLAELQGVHPLILIGTICIVVTLLSEIASNTATATLMMPLLAAAAKGADVDPAVLMLPAALAASCGFMLPVATPPNAIAYGTGRVPTRTMMRQGFLLDVAGIVAITLLCWLLISPDGKFGLERSIPATTNGSGEASMPKAEPSGAAKSTDPSK